MDGEPANGNITEEATPRTNITHRISELSALTKFDFKPPAFWRSDPTLWFAQIDSIFVRNKILADQTKFHCVVSTIESAILAQVSDIVKSPPPIGAYEELKKRLIAHFSDSEEQRLRKLLQQIELGDRKPSHLLQEMRHLGAGVNEDILKTLWMQRLPTNIQTILAACSEPLPALAIIADKCYEVRVFNSFSEVSEVRTTKQATFTNPEQRSNTEDKIEELEVQIRNLTKAINRLSRSRSSSRSNFHANAHEDGEASNTKNGKELCWYHRKYGKKAKKCGGDCSYQQEN